VVGETNMNWMIYLIVQGAKVVNIEDHQKILSECHARHGAEIETLRKDIILLREACRKIQHWHIWSGFKLRKADFKQLEAALAATEHTWNQRSIASTEQQSR